MKASQDRIALFRGVSFSPATFVVIGFIALVTLAPAVALLILT